MAWQSTFIKEVEEWTYKRAATWAVEGDVRFTRNNRQQVLDQNEGYKTETSYSGKNFSETRVYEIKDGGLEVHSASKTSWADSRHEDTYRYSADSDETKRFLRNNRDALNTDGID